MCDTKLPGLQQATNGEAMRSALATALRRNLEPDRVEFTGVRPQVLKHAVGKRCVIEYALEPQEDCVADGRVIGKLYRKNRGEKIHEHLLDLWQATRATGGHTACFGMPEPLAYLPELGMTLQSVVPGRQLSALSEPDDLAWAMKAAGENLAVLHGLALPALEKKTVEDHLAKYCHPSPGELMAACPELAPLAEGILEGIRTDGSLLLAPLCPVHGDLGLDQIFVTAQGAFFIDFDGFCLSHPALDLGNFLVALQVHYGAQSGVMWRIFLESYLARQSHRMLSGFRAYQAFTYLRRATICLRHQATTCWRDTVRSLLKTGYALFLQPERYTCRVEIHV